MFMYLHLASPQTIQASNTWNTLYFLCILLSRFFPKYLFISLDPEALYKQIYFRIPQTPIRKLAKIWLPSSKPDIDQNCLRLAAPHHWVWKAAFTFLTMTSTIGLHYTYCRLTTNTHISSFFGPPFGSMWDTHISSFFGPPFGSMWVFPNSWLGAAPFT
jgi:hypothetical protein